MKIIQLFPEVGQSQYNHSSRMADPYVSVPFQIGGEPISFFFKASTVQKVAEQNALPKVPKVSKKLGIHTLPVIPETKRILTVKRVKFNNN